MPEDVHALIKEADEAQEQKEWDAAIEIYKSVEEVEPNNEEACSKLAKLYSIRGLVSKVIEQYFNLMDILERKEEYELAVEVAHWIMRLQPENDKARMKTILIYKEKGDLEEVVKQSLQLARLYRELNQGDQSILLLKNAQEIAPNNLDIGLELAEMYISHGHIQEGTNQYRKIANAYLSKGRLDKASDAFRRMKIVVPDDPQLLFTLGNLYMQLGKLNDAEAEFRAILRHNLNHTEALMALGKVCQKKGQFRDAILAFNKILSVNPQNEVAKEKLGELFQAQGASNEAVKHYLQAANTYQYNEEPERAIKLYQRVLTIDNTNPTACRELTNLGAPLVAEEFVGEPDSDISALMDMDVIYEDLDIAGSLEEMAGTIMPKGSGVPGAEEQEGTKHRKKGLGTKSNFSSVGAVPSAFGNTIGQEQVLKKNIGDDLIYTGDDSERSDLKLSGDNEKVKQKKGLRRKVGGKKMGGGLIKKGLGVGKKKGSRQGLKSRGKATLSKRGTLSRRKDEKNIKEIEEEKVTVMPEEVKVPELELEKEVKVEQEINISVDKEDAVVTDEVVQEELKGEYLEEFDKKDEKTNELGEDEKLSVSEEELEPLNVDESIEKEESEEQVLDIDSSIIEQDEIDDLNLSENIEQLDIGLDNQLGADEDFGEIIEIQESIDGVNEINKESQGEAPVEIAETLSDFSDEKIIFDETDDGGLISELPIGLDENISASLDLETFNEEEFSPIEENESEAPLLGVEESNENSGGVDGVSDLIDLDEISEMPEFENIESFEEIDLGSVSLEENIELDIPEEISEKTAEDMSEEVREDKVKEDVKDLEEVKEDNLEKQDEILSEENFELGNFDDLYSMNGIDDNLSLLEDVDLSIDESKSEDDIISIEESEDNSVLEVGIIKGLPDLPELGENEEAIGEIKLDDGSNDLDFKFNDETSQEDDGIAVMTSLPDIDDTQEGESIGGMFDFGDNNSDEGYDDDLSGFADLLKMAEEIENIIPDEERIREAEETKRHEEESRNQVEGYTDSQELLKTDDGELEPLTLKEEDTFEIDESAIASETVEMDALVDPMAIPTSFLPSIEVPSDEEIASTKFLEGIESPEEMVITEEEEEKFEDVVKEEVAVSYKEPEVDIEVKIKEYIKEGNLGSVFPLIEEALEKNPDKDSLRQEYADLCYDYGLIDKSLKAYNQILERDPNNKNVRKKIIRGHLIYDHYDKAIDSLIGYGGLLLQEKDLDEAQRVYQYVLALDEENPKARESLSEIYLDLQMKQLALYHLSILSRYLEKEGTVDEIIKVLKKIFGLTSEIDIQEKLASVYIENDYFADAIVELQALAERYMSKEDYRKSAENYEKVIELDSKHIEAHNKLVKLYTELHDKERSYKEEVIVADLLIEKNQINEARIRYERCLKSKSYDNNVRRKLIDIYLKLDNFERALEESKVLSEVYHKERRYDEAILMYNLLINHSPRNLALRERLSEFYVMADQLEKGIEQLIIVAEEFSNQHSWNDAIKMYKKVVIIDDSIVEVHFRLGEIYLKQKKNSNDARLEFESVYKLDNTHKKSLEYLVDLYIEDREPAKAAHMLLALIELDNSYSHMKKTIIERYKNMVKEKPGDLKQHFNLGIVYKEMGMWKQAIEQFQITRKSNDFVIESHNMLGICFAQQPPMLSLAVKTLTKGLELKGFPEKDYVDLHYNLGKLYEKLGKFDKSCSEYQAVLAIDSGYKDTAELLKKIKEKV